MSGKRWLVLIVCAWYLTIVILLTFCLYDSEIKPPLTEREEEPFISISEKYGIPEPYYLDVSSNENEKGNKNISQLKEVLNEMKYPQGYEKGVFDCSEMSAYMEWFLENKSFSDTVICTNLTWGHAYVRTDINGEIITIECVPPVFITSYELYNRPEDIYLNIYDAMEHSSYPREFDWWGGYNQTSSFNSITPISFKYALQRNE